MQEGALTSFAFYDLNRTNTAHEQKFTHRIFNTKW